MALTDALPGHALHERTIDELRSKDRFREVYPNLTAIKSSTPFDLVVGFQLMRENDSVGFGFNIEEEEWEIIESAAYADAGGVDAAGKVVADALEEWSPADGDVPPDIWAGFSNGDNIGDIQAREDIEFSEAVYAQYRTATSD